MTLSRQVRLRPLAGMALAMALGSIASSAAALTPPDGVFSAHNPATASDTALERVTPNEWVHLRSNGGGAGSSYLEFDGAKSPVRFTAGQAVEFQVDEASTGAEVVGLLRLFRLDLKADSRQLVLTQTGADGPDGWVTSPVVQVPLTAHDQGDGLVKLVPNASLAPGEYCLAGPGTHDGFCFGVDP